MQNICHYLSRKTFRNFCQTVEWVWDSWYVTRSESAYKEQTMSKHILTSTSYQMYNRNGVVSGSELFDRPDHRPMWRCQVLNVEHCIQNSLQCCGSGSGGSVFILAFLTRILTYYFIKEFYSFIQTYGTSFLKEVSYRVPYSIYKPCI